MKNKYILCLTTVLLFTGVFWAHATEIDEQIEAAARDSYVFKEYLKNDNIKIKSDQGVITLSGTVTDDNHKSLAQETVAEIPGVEKVNNEITLAGENPPQNSDAWIGTKAKTALLLKRNVSAMNTNIDVKDGIVTLMGKATSQAQKDLTAEYVKDVEGVKGVKNEIQIVESEKESSQKPMGEKIDDASITAQVKLALLWNRSTSGLRTGVKTTDGVVTLTGKAKNEAEIDLATKLVKDIKGVKNVMNQMTVN